MYEITEKWVFVNPSHRFGIKAGPIKPWDNDSFSNLSRIFDGGLYHVIDENIDLNADIYQLCQYDINLIELEIEFLKKIKNKGAKIIVCFSHDGRFLLGKGLLNDKGSLYTEICEYADIIAGGVNPSLRMFGRYQHKVIDMEILEDINFSMPYEQRDIDFLCCTAPNESSLSFEIELLLMYKEKYPDKKAVCLIHGAHIELIKTLKAKFPQITIPFNEGQSLLHYMKRAKVFCNPEIRPRPGRSFMEAYYCRVPFISPYPVYFSTICPEFSFENAVDYYTILEKYELIQSRNFNDVIKDMETKAEYCSFDNVYKRIKNKLGLN